MPSRPPLPARSVLIATALAVLAFGPAQAEKLDARIDSIAVHLVYQRSGTLSENIAPPSKFTAWNTVIGEGDAKEPANDLMVFVHLAIPGDQGNSSVALEIKVRNEARKVVASRKIGHQFFDKGRSVHSLQAQDAACAGKLTIEARLGKATKTTQVAMMCGE